jgi:hypothetical protein
MRDAGRREVVGGARHQQVIGEYGQRERADDRDGQRQADLGDVG